MMASTEIEKVLAVFEGISTKDADLATRYIDNKRFMQHNPRAADGVEGLRQFISRFPREQLHMTVVRALQDGAYVVTQAKGQRSGQNIFFDIFRFENGLIVEHWAFATIDAPPNESGHTQTDGPTQVNLLANTEKNKALVRNYYETIHVSGEHKKISRYFSGDHCIRHEPGVRDGVAAFTHDLERLVQNRSIDHIELVLGQGDFVFIAAKGSVNGEPCVYVDLYRVEEEKIVERWGFSEGVPPQGEWKNDNGML